MGHIQVGETRRVGGESDCEIYNVTLGLSPSSLSDKPGGIAGIPRAGMSAGHSPLKMCFGDKPVP
jgi:hypothetical protein